MPLWSLPQRLGLVFLQSGLLVTVVKAAHWKRLSAQGTGETETQPVLGLPELCGLAWAVCTQSSSHVQIPTKMSWGHLHPFCSPASSPSLYCKGLGRHLSVCKSLQYDVGWKHGPDVHLPFSSLLCSSIPLYPPRRASYTWTSLAQQRRWKERWKGAKVSLLDNCASSTKSRKKKIDPDGI